MSSDYAFHAEGLACEIEYSPNLVHKRGYIRLMESADWRQE